MAGGRGNVSLAICWDAFYSKNHSSCLCLLSNGMGCGGARGLLWAWIHLHCVWGCQMALCLVVTGSPWTCQPFDQGWFAALTCPGTVRELIIAFWHWAFPDYIGEMNFLLIKAQSLIFDCFHFESNCCRLCRWQGIFILVPSTTERVIYITARCRYSGQLFISWKVQLCHHMKEVVSLDWSQ